MLVVGRNSVDLGRRRGERARLMQFARGTQTRKWPHPSSASPSPASIPPQAVSVQPSQRILSSLHPHSIEALGNEPVLDHSPASPPSLLQRTLQQVRSGCPSRVLPTSTTRRPLLDPPPHLYQLPNLSDRRLTLSAQTSSPCFLNLSQPTSSPPPSPPSRTTLLHLTPRPRLSPPRHLLRPPKTEKENPLESFLLFDHSLLPNHFLHALLCAKALSLFDLCLLRSQSLLLVMHLRLLSGTRHQQPHREVLYLLRQHTRARLRTARHSLGVSVANRASPRQDPDRPPSLNAIRCSSREKLKRHLPLGGLALLQSS